MGKIAERSCFIKCKIDLKLWTMLGIYNSHLLLIPAKYLKFHMIWLENSTTEVRCIPHNFHITYAGFIERQALPNTRGSIKLYKQR